MLYRETVCQASVLLLFWLSAVMEIPVLNACLIQVFTAFFAAKGKERSREGEKNLYSTFILCAHKHKKKLCDLYTKVLAMWTNTLVHSNYYNCLNKSNAFFFMSKIHQQLLEEGKKKKKKTAGCHFSITIGPKIWVLVNVPTFWIYAHILVFIQLGFCIVLFLNVWNEGYVSRLIWTRQVALQPCRSAVIENVSARGCSGAVLNDEILG